MCGPYLESVFNNLKTIYEKLDNCNTRWILDIKQLL